MSHILKILLLWFTSSNKSKKKNLLILPKMSGKERFAREVWRQYHREFLWATYTYICVYSINACSWHSNFPSLLTLSSCISSSHTLFITSSYLYPPLHLLMIAGYTRNTNVWFWKDQSYDNEKGNSETRRRPPRRMECQYQHSHISTPTLPSLILSVAWG